MNRISELPDDILLYVLSSLTLKELGRTSVLSKRWRHMWAYIPTLIFDYSHIPTLLVDYSQIVLGTDTEKPQYLNFVNKLVSSHKAPTIDEFRVCIDIGLLDDGSNSFDSWFQFAIAKRVKRLEIDFLPRNRPRISHGHTFPSVSLCSTLTSLKLGLINIDGQVLEGVLSNCLAHEYLSVKFSKSLVHLKVSGPSLNLKHLTIYACPMLRQFEIFAPKLESFSYFGPKIDVEFKSTPKLVQVYVGAAYAQGLKNMCLDLSSYLSQIEVLTIDNMGTLDYLNRDDSILFESPRRSILFARLTKLDLKSFLHEDGDLYSLTLLIKACPLLQHFKLRLITILLQRPLFDDSIDALDCETREQRKWEACPHYHLEILEIVGFIGYPIDLEFATYLMESALSLNKIIADTRDGLKVGDPDYSVDTEERRLARERAELLRENIKPTTKLEIV